MATGEINGAPGSRAPAGVSLWRAWWAVVAHTFGRHWQVRQMGGVALGLLALVVVAVAVVSQRPGGWGFGERVSRRTGMSYRQAAELHLPHNRYLLETPPALLPRPWDPYGNALQSLILSIPHAVMQSEQLLSRWAFINYSRWVVLGSYLGFVLPLFTLAYATAAIGAERESRSMVWLLTRPLPRGAIYLATFVGTLPWCLLFGVGGFVALGLAGGDLGRQALAIYWPAALAGTLALTALFHLVGAVFRRPIVVGLVYVFFYEALVAALPGSLKKFSVNFYTRSLMHDEAIAAGYPGAMLEGADPVSPASAWLVLLLVTVALTTLGMGLFARREQRDDV